MKNEKGITLIALIITIIVMLILVGVTINIAINGGLFGQASDAVRKQEEQTIYEQIVGMSAWNEDGTINIAETYLTVKNTFGENNVSELGADGTFTVTGKHGVYKYKIESKEISIDKSETISKEEALLSLQGLIDVDPNVSMTDSNARIYINSNDESFIFNIPNETIEFKTLSFSTELCITVVYKNYWYDITVIVDDSNVKLGTVSESKLIADVNDIFEFEVLDSNNKTVKIKRLTEHGEQLDTIVIPKNIVNITNGEEYTVKEIANSAFSNIHKNISFAEDSEVIKIGDYAFKGAFNNENIPTTFVFPSTLEYIGREVLGEYVYTEETEPLLQMNGTLIIPKTVTEISPWAFNQTGFTKIIFEEGSQINRLNNQSFTNMFNLTEIYLPGTIIDFHNPRAICIDSSRDNSTLTIYYDGTSENFKNAWWPYSDKDEYSAGLNVVCTDGEFYYNSSGELVKK